MGLLYLTDLADVCRRAMPYVTQVIEVDGWQKRARGSGGYPGRVKGRSAHHDAGGPLSDGWPAVNYETFISDAKPVAAVHLDRKAICWVCAAGATNTIGKGGPMGEFAKDDGNAWQLGREEGNNGVGEPWPEVQVRAGIELDAQWFLAYGDRFGWRFPLDPDQFFDHRRWAPGRKIDRKGDARCVVAGVEYVFADGYEYWDTDLVLAAINRRIQTLRATNGGTPIVVTPTQPPATKPDPKPTQPTPSLPTAPPITPGADMSQVTELVEVKGAVFAVVDHGVSKFWIARGEPQPPNGDAGSVAHVAWRWRANGTHNGTSPVIRTITNESEMHGLGPVSNCNVPSAEHGGQTLTQLGWDQYGWRD